MFLGVLVGGIIIAGIILFILPVSWRKEEKIPSLFMPNTQVFKEEIINLPAPRFKGEMSLEEAILKRRSRRDYQEKSLTLEQISQILWAAQGITEEETGFRSAPSAGALYPLEIYIVVGGKGVKELKESVYHFIPQGHKIEKKKEGDLRQDLMRACLDQSSVAQAPIVLIITAEYERTTQKYGDRGKQYVHMEAGHAAQNIYLQVESLGLATVTIGSFDGEEIGKILNLPPNYTSLYVMPLGYPR